MRTSVVRKTQKEQEGVCKSNKARMVKLQTILEGYDLAMSLDIDL